MRQARVTAAHRSPARPAIRVNSGDQVTLGERDTEWPAFTWVTLANGLGGWMPATIFTVAGERATALQDYDTRELDVDEGEVVVLHREMANWWWAENAAGDTGWVPSRNVGDITGKPS